LKANGRFAAQPLTRKQGKSKLQLILIANWEFYKQNAHTFFFYNHDLGQSNNYDKSFVSPTKKSFMK